MARGGRAGPGLVALLLAALTLLPGGAPVQPGPRGAARVSDGDTLRVGGAVVRIFGIDAPERAQSCGAWACGEAARARLVALVAEREVACVRRDTDRYGRVVATCRAGDTDLGRALVAEGLAWAFRRYAADYIPDEAAAKAAGRGVWRTGAEAPWDYRADLRAARTRAAEARAESEAGDCRVKGNISADGERIYHLPGSAAYARTRISTAKGERWFCDETAAVAAGWRAPRG
ncbi:thermonuclease family protein [Amaricoccus solimangrovi]|uniref:Thermonuclease family protein n=2 Tax=Amaricoccus solimangrovi TaxID=2589815 RepID=A0A501WX38_9RHOB|nr:thermonuclease family protein [Amaricoccus solimangrovi]